MKKIFFLLIALVGFGLSAQAQPSVTVTGKYDTNQVICSAPAQLMFYLYGQTDGYLQGDSMQLIMDFGDGSIDTLDAVVGPVNTLTMMSFVSGILTHTYQNPGTYDVQYKIVMYDGNSDSLFVPDETIIANNCDSISGKVYVDNNNNCIYDSGDDLTHALVIGRIPGSPTIAWISRQDANGGYLANVQAGTTYEVELSNWATQTYQLNCPSTGSHSATAPTGGIDFGLECLPGLDLELVAYISGLTPNRTIGHFIEAQNRYCSPIQNVQYKFGFLDPQVSLVSSALPTPDSTAGDSIYFHDSVRVYNNQTLGDANGYPITVWCDSLAQIGDTVCFEISVTTPPGDLNPSNNHKYICRPILASYDPNNKIADPIGKGPEGKIHPNQTMTYTINFQNTGTAPAGNIYILDTLDTQVLDPASLRILGSSHNLTNMQLTGDELRFEFDSINLPDSTNNEPESHGWVMYEIDQVANLSPGTTIDNRAAIYFDWNPPVITAYAHNTILEPPVSVDGTLISNPSALASIYPNPARDQLNIRLQQASEANYRLLDITGKVLQSGQVRGQAQLSTLDLPNGLYLLMIDSQSNGSGGAVSDRQVEKIIVQH